MEIVHAYTHSVGLLNEKTSSFSNFFAALQNPLIKLAISQAACIHSEHDRAGFFKTINKNYSDIPKQPVTLN